MIQALDSQDGNMIQAQYTLQTYHFHYMAVVKSGSGSSGQSAWISIRIQKLLDAIHMDPNLDPDFSWIRKKISFIPIFLPDQKTLDIQTNILFGDATNELIHMIKQF